KPCETSLDVLMKNLGRWSLGVAVLAICGWMWLRSPPEPTLAAISTPPAAADGPARASTADRTAGVRGGARARGPLQANQRDWVVRFHAEGSNYFEFVSEAARAAYAGDGAAQYYIGRAMARCEETNALYQDADNVDQAVSHLAFSPTFLERERQEYLGC